MKDLISDSHRGLNESVSSTTVSGRGRVRANGTPPSRPAQPHSEGSGPVHIVPAANSNGTHPQEVERMARADACPTACGNVSLPNIVHGWAGGFRAHYTCIDCGHDWFTDWRD